MKKLLFLIPFFLLSACNIRDEYFALDNLEAKEKIWVFVQINVREETEGLESYYYYAQIPQKVYSAISNNEINQGFILLSEVKYWGEDDLIKDYKDIENSGELVFRIENLVRIDRLNIGPIAGLGIEQFYDDSDDKEQETSESTEAEPATPAAPSPEDPAEQTPTPENLPKIDPYKPVGTV